MKDRALLNVQAVTCLSYIRDTLALIVIVIVMLAFELEVEVELCSHLLNGSHLEVTIILL